MRKILIVLLISLFMLGCVRAGQVIDEQGTVYSEYFQCLLFSGDRSYSFDALSTLGKERLPSSYILPKSKKNFLTSPDMTLVVNEVYVRNHKNEALTIENLIVWENSLRRVYTPKVLSIAPNSFVKTGPIVDVTSIYGPDEIPCKIEFDMNGGNYVLTGKWRRLTVDELSR